MDGSAAPQVGGMPPLPPGLRVAGMGSRIGAWLVDSLVLGMFQLAFWLFVGAVGVVRIDPEAQRQLEASPLALPTVAPYQANLPLLAILLAAFVVGTVAYATVCWSRLRGTPGQRLLSLQVGSAATGRNLGLGRAFLRAAVAVGIPIAAAALVYYALFSFETSVPWSDVMNPQPGGPADAWLSTWFGLLALAVLAALGWPAVLLVSTATSRTRQGFHDRLAGSLVVGNAPTSAWAGSAYGQRSGPAHGPASGPSFSSPGYGRQPGYLPPHGTQPPNTSAEPGTAAGGPSTPGEPAPPGALPPGTSAEPLSEPEWRPAASPFGESEARPTYGASLVNRRIAAYLVDCFVVLMIWALTESVAAVTLLPSGSFNFDERTFILLGLVGGLEQLAYFAGGWTIWRGTLVQRVMRLRVEDVTTGKALSLMDAIVRWAILQGPFALVTIVPDSARIPVELAAAFWAVFLLSATRTALDGRGPHDRFLNCRVTRDG